MKGLTKRQTEILELIARGLTNDEVASVVGISVTTVRTHVSAILARLDVTNRTEAVVLFCDQQSPAKKADRVLGRPMIAVLPFLVVPPRSDTEHFGVAIATDLSSLFARWSWFPVIATQSVRGVRDLGTSRAIGAHLRARYLVDGTILVGDPVVLHVRIDDTTTGACLWTERYQCELDGFFELENALANQIVASAYPTLIAHAAPARTLAPETLNAWDRAHLGIQLCDARSAAENRAARAHFRAALKESPELVLAHYGTGLALYDALLNQWQPARDDEAERLAHAASIVLDLAPHAAEGHYLLARRRQAAGDIQGAREALEAATNRNPSFARGHALLAQMLQMEGRSDPAMDAMQRARQLNPRAFAAGLSVLHFSRGEYEEALRTAERCLVDNAGYTFAYVLAGASAQVLGDEARARAHVRTLRTRHPTFDPCSLLTRFGSDIEAVARLVRIFAAISDR